MTAHLLASPVDKYGPARQAARLPAPLAPALRPPIRVDTLCYTARRWRACGTHGDDLTGSYRTANIAQD